MKALREDQEALVKAKRELIYVSKNTRQSVDVYESYCEKLYDLYENAAKSMIRQAINTANMRMGFEFTSIECEIKIQYIITKMPQSVFDTSIEALVQVLFEQNIVNVKTRNIFCEACTGDHFSQIKYTLYINKTVYE